MLRRQIRRRDRLSGLARETSRIRYIHCAIGGGVRMINIRLTRLTHIKKSVKLLGKLAYLLGQLYNS